MYSSMSMKIVNCFRVWCAQEQRFFLRQIKLFYYRGRYLRSFLLSSPLLSSEAFRMRFQNLSSPHGSIYVPAVQNDCSSRQILLHTQIIYEKHL